MATLRDVKPELAGLMAERRLVQIIGERPDEGAWMTEGDKLGLRREQLSLLTSRRPMARQFAQRWKGQCVTYLTSFMMPRLISHVDLPEMTHTELIWPCSMV